MIETILNEAEARDKFLFFDKKYRVYKQKQIAFNLGTILFYMLTTVLIMTTDGGWILLGMLPAMACSVLAMRHSFGGDNVNELLKHKRNVAQLEWISARNQVIREVNTCPQISI